MLKQRIFTALILLVGFILITTMLSPLYFSLLLACLVALAAYEWSAFFGFSDARARLAYVATLALGMAALLALFQFETAVNNAIESRITVVLLLGILFWAFVVRWLVLYPKSTHEWSSDSLIGMMGLLALLPAWTAVVTLKYLMPQGYLVISCVIFVASVDVGAYFAGSYLGKTPLAPALSPKKTWEGVAGGMALCLVVTSVTAVLTQRFLFPLTLFDLCLFGVLALMVTFFSVTGDLLESMLKRNSDLKDTGSILPGHGGVLDRIDAIIAVAPVFVFLALLFFGDRLATPI